VPRPGRPGTRLGGDSRERICLTGIGGKG
jgi:hypothetical protein